MPLDIAEFQEQGGEVYLFDSSEDVPEWMKTKPFPLLRAERAIYSGKEWASELWEEATLPLPTHLWVANPHAAERQLRLLRARRNTVAAHAEEDILSWATRLPAAKTEERALVWTTRFSMFVHGCARDCVDGLKKNGIVSTLLCETGPRQRHCAASILSEIAEFQPTIVLAIDTVRPQVAPWLPPEIKYVSWMQDDLEHRYNTETAKQCGENDFFLVQTPKLGHELIRRGFRPSRIADCISAVNTDIFRNLGIQRSGACFMGNMDPKQAPEVDRFLAWVDRKGLDISDIVAVEDYLPYAEEVWGKHYSREHTLYACARYIRDFVGRWAHRLRRLSELKETVYVFGDGWGAYKTPKHLKVFPAVEHGEQLNLVMNSYEHCIVQHHYSTGAQRYLEAVAAGCVPIVLPLPADKDEYPVEKDFRLENHTYQRAMARMVEWLGGFK